MRVGHGLAVELLQLGLVIERVDLRRPADHEEEDDRLGLGGEIRLAGGEGIERIDGEGFDVGGARFLAEERFEGEGAEAGAGAREELASR